MNRMPMSLMFLMFGYIGILAFATLFCHMKQHHYVHVDEKVLHRIET